MTTVPSSSQRLPHSAPRVLTRRNAADEGPEAGSSAAVFLVLRRLRAPLIVLILVFAVSVLGLTLIPGVDDEGRTVRTGVFDAFYFMSYTATTIGFGEIPYAFTDAQRLWVVVCIYLTVVGWAYAIGSLLTLLQDRAFRQALARQHFSRKVARLRSPFVVVAGYGQTGELIVRSFDALGRRLVVVDSAPDRIDALELASYRFDVPGLVADVRSAHQLRFAGIRHPSCAGVLALTNDDEANLAVVISAALLRPGLPVVARTLDPTIAHRMRAFGAPTVVDPFDRFGEHLLLALAAPASYQLLDWLQSGPGADLPPQGRPPQGRRWVVCGYGRFGRAVAADLRSAGLEVTVVEASGAAHGELPADVEGVHADGTGKGVLELADLAGAGGFVAGTDNDTTNLSLLAAARRLNSELFLVARQNQPEDAMLFEAMAVDAVLVPTDLVAHEAYAHLSTPLLWRFLQEMPAQGDDWAQDVLERLVERCGDRLPPLWKVHLTEEEAPAVAPWLAAGEVRLGDLLRSPELREETLPVVAMLLLRGEDSVLMPEPDVVLAVGDQLLLAGRGTAHRELDSTLVVDAVCAYVLTGERQPVSLLWRLLTDRGEARATR